MSDFDTTCSCLRFHQNVGSSTRQYVKYCQWAAFQRTCSPRRAIHSSLKWVTPFLADYAAPWQLPPLAAGFVFAQRYRRDFRVLFTDMSWETYFTPRNLDLLFCIGFLSSRCSWQALTGQAFLLCGLLNFAFPPNFVPVQVCWTYDAGVPTQRFRFMKVYKFHT